MYLLRADCSAVICLREVNLIQRPACCWPIFWRICFGSLSSAPLKKESAHAFFSGMMIATFFLLYVKQGLPHFNSSIRPQSSAIFLSLSASFCHFFAYGTFIGHPMHRVRSDGSVRPEVRSKGVTASTLLRRFPSGQKIRRGRLRSRSSENKCSR